ncbi:MAG: enoyl-CoA hydratase [Candidatus Paracaedibacteraceae bacterium]|nr:enoyl-CoA hydratase [Candidatus Paracaedibacteraceae bacterium]
MMTEPHILVTQEGPLLSIRINRPDKKNALTNEMYDGLTEALLRACENDQIIAVKLEGVGDCFTAGNDLIDFLSMEGLSPTASAPRFLKALASFPKILMAVVQGAAVGIGTTLLLHCDFVIAANNTRFQLPFINLALVPEAASSLLLPARIGYLRAAELLLFGEPFSAETALQLGIVNRIVEQADLEACSGDILNKLFKKDPAALFETKRLLKLQLIDVEERMKEEFKAFGTRLAAPAFKTMAEAFFQSKK